MLCDNVIYKNIIDIYNTICILNLHTICRGIKISILSKLLIIYFSLYKENTIIMTDIHE